MKCFYFTCQQTLTNIKQPLLTAGNKHAEWTSSGIASASALLVPVPLRAGALRQALHMYLCPASVDQKLDLGWPAPWQLLPEALQATSRAGNRV